MTCYLSCCESIYPSVELFHLNSPLVPSGTRFYPVIRLVDLAHTCGRIVVQISYYFKIIEICKNPNFCPVRTKFTKSWYLPCIARGVRARYPNITRFVTFVRKSCNHSLTTHWCPPRRRPWCGRWESLAAALAKYDIQNICKGTIKAARWTRELMHAR